MKIYITIDGGTTNTRLYLVRDDEIIDNINLSIGARASIVGKDKLENEVKQAIENLLCNNNLQEKDVICILASGMITSEFGLCNVDHISLPAGIEELHATMHKTKIESISNIPFVFVRGVKKVTDNFEDTDIMRGEETELMGIITEHKDCVYVLPGSHSKIIKVNAGKITDFSTLLTGEMIATLAEHTILKDAVDLNIAAINNEYLIKGYECCKKQGINNSLFKTRILKNIFKSTKEELYSFFMGVVLCGDAEQILKYDVKTVVIGGKKQIKNALAEILKSENKNVMALDEKIIKKSTVLGIIRIFENKQRRNNYD